MLDEDICKTVMITKSRLFEWKVMPFGLKNVIGIFFGQWKKTLRIELISF
jgi:hypothetical protein